LCKFHKNNTKNEIIFKISQINKEKRFTINLKWVKIYAGIWDARKIAVDIARVALPIDKNVQRG